MMSELTKVIGTHGVNWNVADREGNTPLHLCDHLCDSPDHIASLLQTDANPNATNKVTSAQPNPPPFSTTSTSTTYRVQPKPTFVAALPFYTPLCP